MSCLTLGFWENILIWVIVFAAAWALLELLIGFIASKFDPGGAVSLIQRALFIIFWAAVAIFAVILIFSLISCLLGAGHFHLPSIH